MDVRNLTSIKPHRTASNSHRTHIELKAKNGQKWSKIDFSQMTFYPTFGHCWVILDHIYPIFTLFGLFWTILGVFDQNDPKIDFSKMTFYPTFGHFWVILDHIYAIFSDFQSFSAHYPPPFRCWRSP